MADAILRLTDEEIAEVKERVLPYFEPGARVSLEAADDPDSPDDHRTYMVIHTRLEPTQALAALDKFDSAWWLDQTPRFAGRLEVTIRCEQAGAV